MEKLPPSKLIARLTALNLGATLGAFAKSGILVDTDEVRAELMQMVSDDSSWRDLARIVESETTK